MRIMAVDYGDAHTGVAISDPTGMLAGWTTTINSRSQDVVVEQLKAIIAQRGVEELVLGYPKNMNDTKGERVIKSEALAARLEAETGRHVVWGYCHRQGRYFTLPFDFIQVHFPGTGDVFSAVLIGELLAGTGLEQAARKAMDTVERLVCLDRNEVEKNKGIRIERFLKELDL